MGKGQTNRQAETDRHTNRQNGAAVSGKKTDRQAETDRQRQTDRQTNRQNGKAAVSGKKKLF